MERINVILGTNGAGKSKLLNAFEMSARSREDIEFQVVRVTTSKGFFPPLHVSNQTNQGKAFDDFDKEVKEEMKFQELTLDQLKNDIEMIEPLHGRGRESRLEQALKHFSTSLASEKVEYRKRHYEWMANGGHATPPIVPKDRDAEAHLDKLLSLFNEIFPEIRLKAKDFQYSEKERVVPNNGVSLAVLLKRAQIIGSYSFRLACFKGEQEYEPSHLSEGEKQILSMLADRFYYKDKKCLFLVDEPELNLDPVLAIKYWNLLEREMPDSVFVYTTHSLDFALRESVERIWSIGRGIAQQIPLDTLGTLPAEEQRRFLSGIRGIIRTNKGLVVEGKESSFDAKFYPWILGDQSDEFQISYYEGSNDVRAATRKLDIWQQMVPTVTILGIVDADYRSQKELKKLDDTNCHCLGLHDAESYLCHPELLIALAKELKRQSFPTQEELLGEICQFLEKTMVEICHHRMAQRCSAYVAVSLHKKELDRVLNFEELTEKVCESAIKQARAGLDFSEDHVESILNEERRKCLKAKNEKNIEEMLNLVKGKKLVERLAKHFGLKDSLELMDYVSTNLSPGDFEHTRTLRKQIEEHFATSDERVEAPGSPIVEIPSPHATPPTQKGPTAAGESGSTSSNTSANG